MIPIALFGWIRSRKGKSFVYSSIFLNEIRWIFKGIKMPSYNPSISTNSIPIENSIRSQHVIRFLYIISIIFNHSKHTRCALFACREHAAMRDLNCRNSRLSSLNIQSDFVTYFMHDQPSCCHVIWLWKLLCQLSLSKKQTEKEAALKNEAVQQKVSIQQKFQAIQQLLHLKSEV